MLCVFNDSLGLQEGLYDHSELEGFSSEQLERVLGFHPEYTIETRKRRVVTALTMLEERGAAPGLAVLVGLYLPVWSALSGVSLYWLTLLCMTCLPPLQAEPWLQPAPPMWTYKTLFWSNPQIIATCPQLIANGLAFFQETLDRWQRCDDELGLPLEKIMAHQSKSRHGFCTSDVHLQQCKQMKLTYKLTSKDMEIFFLRSKHPVGLLSHRSCLTVAACFTFASLL